jgi:hypothetical protein
MSGAVVSTLAGGVSGVSGALFDASGTNAGFRNPLGVAVDASGNVFVADYLNQRVRKVTAGGGTMFGLVTHASFTLALNRLREPVVIPCIDLETFLPFLSLVQVFCHHFPVEVVTSLVFDARMGLKQRFCQFSLIGGAA